jgi:hypothetical protein
MKKTLIGLPLALVVLTAGCVPVFGPAATPMMPYAYRPPAAYGPSVALSPSVAPIGRWDNVMMLPAGAALEVLRTDGTKTSAAFVTATSAAVRVQPDGGSEIEIPAALVLRIDRWLGGPEGAQSVARDAAKGALVGAGAIGVVGLLVGHMPPAHTFGAGAAGGAYQNAELGRAARRSVIVYLAAVSGAR